MKAFANRTVFITGSCSGIGLEMYNAFSLAGARVIGCSDREERLRACNAEFVLGDLNKREDWDKIIRGINEKTDGRGVDVAVLNAGIFTYCAMDQEGFEEQWNTTMRINLHANAYLQSKLVGKMKERKYGRFVYTTSIGALRAMSFGTAAYSASKAAVVMLTKTGALEYGPHGITVNCIAPGVVNTEMTAAFDMEKSAKGNPSGRVGTPKDIANAALFLAAEDNSFVNGATLVVDGGTSVTMAVSW